MMDQEQRHLVVQVHLLGGRFHGQPEWPPSPGRLFQALVAAASRGAALTPEDQAALGLLERLEPPVVAAPPTRAGQAYSLWVPNNDLDRKDGDPARAAELRVSKPVQPRLLERPAALVYAWALPPDTAPGPVERLCLLAHRLYQLGRGVDMAAAEARLLDGAALDGLLVRAGLERFIPSPGGSDGVALDCPGPGTLASLEARFQADLQRFGTFGEGRSRGVLFRQSPKPRFVRVRYNSTRPWALFELHPAEHPDRLGACALAQVAVLVEAIRDAAAARLVGALPERAAEVERALVGRSSGAAPALPPERRVRILPLPSIGHEHVDRSVRRVVVEVPGACPLAAEDVWWAFSALEVPGPAGCVLLERTQDLGMARHYGLTARAPERVWRTVTPAALPEPAGRRRIDPERLEAERAARGRGEPGAEARSGPERQQEEARAAQAVLQALRHAGVTAPVEQVVVRREPFEGHGARAELFSPGTRFAKERLWHIELRFARPVPGPLVLGDGRFLGLGLMAPAAQAPAPWVFAVTPPEALRGAPEAVVAALRRAVMARVQERLARGEALPEFISGHTKEGDPTRAPHLMYTCDPDRGRVLLLPPPEPSGWSQRQTERELARLDQALVGFTTLRAGRAGLLTLTPAAHDGAEDPLFAPSQAWTSCTPYVVNRHRKGRTPAQVVVEDLVRSCHELGLPRPEVTVLRAWGEGGRGLTALAELRFEVAVSGPLVLGRTRFKGGGLFVRAGG